MTTIIVKNANFSGGRIAHYSPPVAGATLCAFVGDQDDGTWLRNFGSGADLNVGLGTPTKVDASFRRFDPANFIVGPAYRTPATTLIAVYRSVAPITKHGMLLSSERPSAFDSGQRGITLMRESTGETVRASILGTSAGAPAASAIVTPVAPAGAAFVISTVIPNAPTGMKSSLKRFSAPESSLISGSSTNVTFAPASDEAAYPFRIGANYLPVQTGLGPIDVGFVAVFPFELTTAEKDAMYHSVQKRFAAFGVTI